MTVRFPLHPLYAIRFSLAATVATLLFGALALAGCSGPDETAPSGAPPRRVIAFAPSITETIFALGRQDALVGVSEFSDYPPAARAIPRCGGWVDPNYEFIVSLRPDLVIFQGEHEALRRFCGARSIPALQVRMDTIAVIGRDLLSMGRALGAEAEAQALWQGLEEELDAIRQRAAGRHKRSVFLSISHREDALSQIMTVGHDAFISEIVAVAGGENVFADLTGYPTISKESLLIRNPDLVLDLRPNDRLTSETRQAIGDRWRAFFAMPGRPTPQVEIVNDDALLIPGPRMAQAARMVEGLLAGEAGEAPPER